MGKTKIKTQHSVEQIYMAISNQLAQDNVVDIFGSNVQKHQDQHPIIEHFFTYFDPKLVTSDVHLNACYHLRHQVYCEELRYESSNDNALETDEFDSYAHSCLITHHPTHQHAGTVRIIHPQLANQLLPIERYYVHDSDKLTVNPSQFERREIAELSRIAIPKMFRRRAIDSHRGSGTGVINTQTYSEAEVRCFPLIAAGLYLSAAAVCRAKGIKHAFAMMDASLARSVEFIGFNCEQIGEYTELHGSRAPYHIDPINMPKLRPAFNVLIEEIEAEFSK